MIVTDDDDQKADSLAPSDDDGDEEREEEERRRGDLDDDDEFFPTVPQSAATPSSRQAVANAPENNADEWRTTRKKKVQRRITHELLRTPSTLAAERVEELFQKCGGDLWSLDLATRQDLYRYWLENYRRACHESVEQARKQFNEAVEQYNQYLQQEDFFILTNGHHCRNDHNRCSQILRCLAKTR